MELAEAAVEHYALNYSRHVPAHLFDEVHAARSLLGKSNSGSVRWRSYIRFDEIPADSLLLGGTVDNADLVLWNHLSNDCGEYVGSGITARRVTERWDVSTLTWSNQPLATSAGANTEYGAYLPGCTRGYMNYEHDLIHSVNGIVQAWADGRTPNKSGGLDLLRGRCRARGRQVAGRVQPRNRTR
ncbi:DNRLRE domain-containing protein [Streptosporangium canum]|uniref:DNRLRE domain-containing protein n=1 Tax=Streptosporangium canum TaxID=324952 RepID=UPI00368B992D